MKKIGIVMPVANEEDSIEETISQIIAMPDHIVWYPVMDYFSMDNTAQIIKDWQNRYPTRIRLQFYEDAHGVATCYLYGFRMALKDNMDYIVEMDAGGSHLFSDFDQFIEKLDEGYECVWGSRFIKGAGIENHPLYRRVLSNGGTIMANLVLGTKLKDMTSGYEAFRADVLESLDLNQFMSRAHMYQTEMRYYCRYRKSIEVPIHYIGSASTLKMKTVTRALKILFQLRKNEKKVNREYHE